MDAQDVGVPVGGLDLDDEGLALKRNRSERGVPFNARGLVNGRGLTNGNGMINGRGMVNGRGLTNGNGMTNGKGLTNGNGMTNGKGLTNGNGMTNGKSNQRGRSVQDGDADGTGEEEASEDDGGDDEERLPGSLLIPPKKHRARPLLVTSIFVIVLLLVMAVFMTLPTETELVTIDGKFDDWGGVARHTDPTDAISAVDIDLQDYAVQLEGDDIALYVRVRGTALSGNDPAGSVDTLLVLLDIDGSPATGFAVLGIGADRAIEVSGWDNTVHTAALKEFGSGRAQNDWNGFASIGAVEAACKGAEMELMVGGGTDWNPGGALRFAIALQNGAQDMDLTAVTGTAPGALRVTQAALGGPNAVVAIGGRRAVLRLDLDTQGALASIRSLTVRSATQAAPTKLDIVDCDLVVDSDRSGDLTEADTILVAHAQYGSGTNGGTTFSMASTPLDLAAGASIRLFVVLNIAQSALPGRAIALHIASTSDILVEGVPVTLMPITGEGVYIAGPTAGVTIDGLFGDWHALLGAGGKLQERLDPSGDAARADVDLVATAAYVEPLGQAGARALFYARAGTNGRMLVGTPVPLVGQARPGPPGPPGPGPGEPPVLTGLDVARFYLSVEGASHRTWVLGLRASHMLEVRGINGAVVDAALYEYIGPGQTSWERRGTTVLAAAAGNELETSLALGGALNVTSYVAVLVGWDGSVDNGGVADIGPLGGETRSSPIAPSDDVPIPEFDQLALPIACTLVIAIIVRRRGSRVPM